MFSFIISFLFSYWNKPVTVSEFWVLMLHTSGFTAILDANVLICRLRYNLLGEAE